MIWLYNPYCCLPYYILLYQENQIDYEIERDYVQKKKKNSLVQMVTFELIVL